MIHHNPILTGFNPDPSIVRVGEDYYIATSTFEWFPGVQIHHSKDLVNWTLVSRPLNRVNQLDLLGVPDSGGVWAPCLTYDDGTFYLIYTNVKSFDGVWKDTPNYLVTSKEIDGEWSDPIFLDSRGFDPSMYHEADGKKYYLSMLVDHREGKLFGGIIMQEYDSNLKQLIGPTHYLFKGTELNCTEGPHMYKRNGYYYLLLAEGGTEYGHAVSIARSKSITGPYEIHPENPILSSRDNPEAPLQKTGHGDLVEGPDGDWHLVFLTGRPLTTRGRCPLGRETAMEEINWKDGWPWLKNGTRVASLNLPSLPAKKEDKTAETVSFDRDQLPTSFQSLRVPITSDWLSLTDRTEALRMYGQESLSSLLRQSLVARRLQHFEIEASTTIDFKPTHFQHMAGLVCFYNTYHWHYLYVSGWEDGSRRLQVLTCNRYQIKEHLAEVVQLPVEGNIHLKVIWKKADLQFYYGLDDGNWVEIGPVLDGSILSDDYVQDAENRYRAAFTGAFIGMCCQDLSGHKGYADFLNWTYKPL